MGYLEILDEIHSHSLSVTFPPTLIMLIRKEGGREKKKKERMKKIMNRENRPLCNAEFLDLHSYD